MVDEDGEYTHWKQDLIGYPHLRGEPGHFVERYKADTMVVERDSLAVIRKLDPNAKLDQCSIVFENDTYVVFSLSR